MTTFTLVTDKDGTFLCDEDGILTPYAPNGFDVIKKIYNRTLDVEGAGLRESDLRELVREIRAMAHEGLK